MVTCYVDHFTFLRNPSGLETASLLGNSLRFSAPGHVGDTTLNCTPVLTVQLNQYDRVTIFDGPNTEVVIVAATASVGASSFTIQSPGLAFQHAAGVAMCSDGVLGSLADTLVNASSDLEDICNQSLFQATWTGEILPMPSMQASIDNQSALTFRPKHYPVTAVSAIQLNAVQGSSVTFDATQAFIDVNQQLVKIPVLNMTGSGGQVFFSPPPFDRTAQQWLTISYTAGFAASALPGEILEAACLLASDILSKRQNPTGADSISLGKKMLTAVIRGDQSGESLLVKQARRKLRRYTRKVV